MECVHLREKGEYGIQLIRIPEHPYGSGTLGNFCSKFYLLIILAIMKEDYHTLGTAKVKNTTEWKKTKRA